MAQKGQVARVHYKGYLDDGTVFDSSEGRDPLEFVVGVGMMIPGFDQAVSEMEVGESKTVHIPCDQAYGQPQEDARRRVRRDAIPDADKLPIGERVMFRGPQGQPVGAKILDVTDDYVDIDFNHELAGSDLNFDITLVELFDGDDED